MRRGGELQRKTPLRSRRRPLPAFSPRRKAEAPWRRAVRAEVFERDGHRCRLLDFHGHVCHGPLTVHHLRKASAGGAYVPVNLVALCAGANGWVEDWPLHAHAIGLAQRVHETPWITWMQMYQAGLSSSPEPGSAP